MSELISKISTYNIFNYLLPGVLFAVVLENLTHYSIIQEDLALGVFVYYFAGLLISRLGSVFIETFLKKISFLQFAEYKEYLRAVKNDAKIEVLSEQNNMYRTFLSLGLSLFFIKLYEVLSIKFNFEHLDYFVLLGLLTVLFLISYRKQTEYIKNRINIINKN